MLAPMWYCNSFMLLVGMQSVKTILENNLLVSHNVIHTLTKWSSNFYSKYLPKGNENICALKNKVLQVHTYMILKWIWCDRNIRQWAGVGIVVGTDCSEAHENFWRGVTWIERFYILIAVIVTEVYIFVKTRAVYLMVRFIVCKSKIDFKM